MTALVLVMLAAGGNPFLSQAKLLHQGLDFEKCIKRLEQASRWDNSPAQLAEIELYSGLCTFGLGDSRSASEHFELALKLQPDLTLPPLVGPKVTSLFNRARAKITKEAVQVAAEPAKAEPPPKATNPEPVEAKPAPAPAPAAAIVEAPPPEPKRRHIALPLILGGVSLVSAGLATYFGVTAKSLETSTHDSTAFESDSIAWAHQASTNALLANVFWAAAGAVLVAAIITFIVM
jgi:hypothetical protein